MGGDRASHQATLDGAPVRADSHRSTTVDGTLTRKAVSYQGNRTLSGLGWMRYKEGFSAGLVSRLLRASDAETVLDPFSGLGTTPLVASSLGMESVGMDIMPVGNTVARAIIAAANDVERNAVSAAFARLLERLDGGAPRDPFPHVRITRGAFPPETEAGLARARAHIRSVDDPGVRLMLDACILGILEDVSYTSKDGQFLRWDARSGRKPAGSFRKGSIPSLGDAVSRRMGDIMSDMPQVAGTFGGPRPDIRDASCLTELATLGDGSVDAVVTSPPYANRYDYTRTYALELAWLGYDDGAIAGLRQEMLSATVENRPKDWLRGGPAADGARAITDGNRTLRGVLEQLRRNAKTLNNPHVIRLLENYFLEMALVIMELGRVVRPGGDVHMVNDNVRYGGVDVPVDVILSEFAESAGFGVESIRVLSRGKGNSSQQMGKYGRSELRKCVYHWRRE